MSPVPRLALPALLALCALLPAPALADDQWTQAPVTSLPLSWWQGMASDPLGSLYFVGITKELYRANGALEQEAAVGDAIGPQAGAIGFNHVGDIAWDSAEGGRLLLPLECFTPGAPGGDNTCGKGAISVNDPDTLAPRYYVALHNVEIQKAM